MRHPLQGNIALWVLCRRARTHLERDELLALSRSVVSDPERVITLGTLHWLVQAVRFYRFSDSLLKSELGPNADRTLHEKEFDSLSSELSQLDSLGS